MSERESWATSAGVRSSMQSNRGRDTRPELAVRRELHRRGLRYFVNRRPVPQVRRTADVVFPRVKMAVLIDGCFWHGCPTHHTPAKANAEYWAEKVRRNRERDRETDELWRESGWTVLRFWTHDPSAIIADTVERAVRSAKEVGGGSQPPCTAVGSLRCQGDFDGPHRPLHDELRQPGRPKDRRSPATAPTLKQGK